MQGVCAIVGVEDFDAEEAEAGYQRFSSSLTALAGSTEAAFEGCGPNTAEDIYAIAFKNNLDTTQEICVDFVRLY